MTRYSNAPHRDDLPHPMQPIGWDGKDVIRFKKNAIVEYLIDMCTHNGTADMNSIARMAGHGLFTDEDQMQFAQLIGYPVSGYGDLSYASAESVAAADAEAEELVKALGSNT